jgi:hypothetical protein
MAGIFSVSCKKEEFVIELSVSPRTLSAESARANHALAVISNTGWTVAASEEWVTFSPAAGKDNGAITLIVDENAATEPREATITLTAGNVVRTATITQEAAEPSLEIDATELKNMTAEAASYSLAVTSNTAWAAGKGNAAWITLNPTTGQGNGAITVNAETNTAAEPRTATITVRAGKHTKVATVTQPGIVPAIGFDLAAIFAAATAGNYSLAVTSNVAWTAQSNAAWLTVSPTTGTGSRTITVAVTENTTAEPREATITVTAGDIVEVVPVIQEAAASVLAIGGEAGVRNIPERAAAYSLTVTSNAAWTAESSAAWLTVNPATGQGNGAISVSVTENAAPETREATITVTAGNAVKTVTVTQTGVEPLLTVNQKELEGIHEGPDSYSLTITSNTAWTAKKSTADWLTVSPTTGQGNGTITVTVTRNAVTQSRSATITVTAGGLEEIVPVIQAGATPSLEINGTKNVTAIAASYPIAITSNVAWTAQSDAAWLTVSPTTGQGNGTISVSVTENTAQQPRSATVTVKAGLLVRTIAVTQAMPVAVLQKTMDFAFANRNAISFTVKAQNVIVDWGDGAPHEYSNTDASFSHTYKNSTGRTVTIYAESLSSFACSNQQLTALDVSGCAALTQLVCDGNRLTALNTSGNPELMSLSCGNNQLTALDMSGNVKLTSLNCRANQITALNISSNAALTQLNCDDNRLSALDVSANTKLLQLNCKSNRLAALNVSGNKALTLLECSANQLTALNVSGCAALSSINCENNQLTTLNTSGCAKLTTLVCDGNRLAALNTSGNTELMVLSCGNNPLTALDVSGNPSITMLYCSNNGLTTLDVSNLTALTRLDCYDNRLTALNMSANTKITRLRCYGNQLSVAALDMLLASLPSVRSGDIYIANNPGSGGCNRSIATAKGWVFKE